jgi:hypothetical protein
MSTGGKMKWMWKEAVMVSRPTDSFLDFVCCPVFCRQYTTYRELDLLPSSDEGYLHLDGSVREPVPISGLEQIRFQNEVFCL